MDGKGAYYVLSYAVFGRTRIIENCQVAEDKVCTFALQYFPTAHEIETVIKRVLIVYNW